jgi:hypothetical protein
VNELEQEVVEHKVRRAVGISALRKIGAIVAEEQYIDTEKARVLHWFVRYGWIVLPCIALPVAYAMGLI